MSNIPTDEELLVGIHKAIETGTMSVFDASVADIMALLEPDPWGNAARIEGIHCGGCGKPGNDNGEAYCNNCILAAQRGL